jgi:RHH-type transcriptional regulator, rel operon repressor / antitoxin RelB
MSVRLSPQLDQQLADIAQAVGRFKARIIGQAMKDFVESQAWHLAAIDKDIRTADGGPLVQKLVREAGRVADA